MTSLIAACALFLLIHSLISGTGLRTRLIRAVGEGGYRAGFSIVSLAAVVWMAMSYNVISETGSNILWILPNIVHALMPVMLLALLFAVIGVTTKNPTSVQQEGLLRQGDPVTGIVRVTRHPFLVGVALWAGAHLLANGDVASVIFFGTFLLVALIGMPNIDRKRAQSDPDGWAVFAARTSRTPFLAIIQGRNSFRLGEIGWWRMALAAAVYATVLVAHGWLFGVPLLG